MDFRNLGLVIVFVSLGLSALVVAASANETMEISFPDYTTVFKEPLKDYGLSYEKNGIFVQADELYASGASKFLVAGVFNLQPSKKASAFGFSLTLTKDDGSLAYVDVYYSSKKVGSLKLSPSDSFTVVSYRKKDLLVRVESLSTKTNPYTTVVMGSSVSLKKGSAVSVNNVKLVLNAVKTKAEVGYAIFKLYGGGHLIEEFALSKPIGAIPYINSTPVSSANSSLGIIPSPANSSSATTGTATITGSLTITEDRIFVGGECFTPGTILVDGKKIRVLMECSGSVCVKEGESLGALLPGNTAECCKGLTPSVKPNSLGSRGICVKADAE